MEEFVDAGSVFKRLRDLVDTKEETVEVPAFDVKYVISSITVCAQRTPVEAQNYKPIADLLEMLVDAVKREEETKEETKTEL